MPEAPLEDDGVATSRPTLACFTCKRRKIRCDRSLPSCSLCVKTLQQCKYPLTPQKPGPKIVKHHRSATTPETPASIRWTPYDGSRTPLT
ncbi:hypothetical protein V2W45_621667 [Cenococcum geophilum]